MSIYPGLIFLGCSNPSDVTSRETSSQWREHTTWRLRRGVLSPQVGFKAKKQVRTQILTVGRSWYSYSHSVGEVASRRYLPEGLGRRQSHERTTGMLQGVDGDRCRTRSRGLECRPGCSRVSYDQVSARLPIVEFHTAEVRLVLAFSNNPPLHLPCTRLTFRSD